MHPLARANYSLTLVDLDGVEKSCQLVKWNNTKRISKCTRASLMPNYFIVFDIAKVFSKLSIIFTFRYILHFFSRHFIIIITYEYCYEYC